MWRSIYVVLSIAVLGWSKDVCGAEIRAMRLWNSPDYTRVVFDVSGTLQYKLLEIDQPNRIVLDLRESALDEKFANPGANGLLKAIRTEKQGKKDIRVVFDLTESVRPKSFLLPPTDKFGYRLVVDLYPKKKSTNGVVKTTEQLIKDKSRSIIIALDAGHGGDDPGAIGAAGTYEKKITLAVARQFKQLIDKQAGFKAVLVRDGDYFVSLKKRYQKARDMKADLFISIHADAFSSTDARGSSVWVLSSRGATSEAARWLADRENRADLVGGVSLDDKDNTLAAVLLDLSQGATLEASNRVAENVLRGLRKLGPIHRGYVERANFVVLRSPDVPSILVETAFITNPAEEKRLNNVREREKLASAILEGVIAYFRTTPPPGTLFAANIAKEKANRSIARNEKIGAAVGATVLSN